MREKVSFEEEHLTKVWPKSILIVSMGFAVIRKLRYINVKIMNRLGLEHQHYGFTQILLHRYSLRKMILPLLV